MSKWISLNHVKEMFNNSIQAIFFSVYISGEMVEVLNVLDPGTNYGERKIVPKKHAIKRKVNLETEWLNLYGAREYFSADPEFYRLTVKKFLKS